jgi:hypothetical protein
MQKVGPQKEECLTGKICEGRSPCGSDAAMWRGRILAPCPGLYLAVLRIVINGQIGDDQIGQHEPTSRYQSAVDECIGDDAPTELAARLLPDCRPPAIDKVEWDDHVISSPLRSGRTAGVPGEISVKAGDFRLS